jgi:hypothetical protein
MRCGGNSNDVRKKQENCVAQQWARIAAAGNGSLTNFLQSLVQHISLEENSDDA